MNTYQALQRIAWRISSRHWKANKNDQEAINTLIDFYENTRKKKIEQNALFAKLFIWVYMHHLKEMNASVFDNEPQKAISRILSYPVETFYVSMTKYLNNTEKYATIAGKRDIEKHPINFEGIDEFSAEDLKQMVTDVWDVKTVEDNLNAMIVEALNRFER